MLVFILFTFNLFCLAPSSALQSIPRPSSSTYTQTPPPSVEQAFKKFNSHLFPLYPMYTHVASPYLARVLEHHSNLVDQNGQIINPRLLECSLYIVTLWEYLFRHFYRRIHTLRPHDPVAFLKSTSHFVGYYLLFRFRQPNASADEFKNSYKDPDKLPDPPLMPDSVQQHLKFISHDSSCSWVFLFSEGRHNVCLKIPNFLCLLLPDYFNHYRKALRSVLQTSKASLSPNSLVEITRPVYSGVFCVSPSRYPTRIPTNEQFNSLFPCFPLDFQHPFQHFGGTIVMTDFIFGDSISQSPRSSHDMATVLHFFFSCIYHHKSFRWVSFDSRFTNFILTHRNDERNSLYRHCFAVIVDFGGLTFHYNPRLTRLPFIYGALDYLFHCTALLPSAHYHALQPFFHSMAAHKPPSNDSLYYSTCKTLFLCSFKQDYINSFPRLQHLTYVLFQCLEEQRPLQEMYSAFKDLFLALNISPTPRTCYLIPTQLTHPRPVQPPPHSELYFRSA